MTQTVGYEAGKGLNAGLGARAGVNYQPTKDVTVGAYAGFNRTLLGDSSDPWGPEVGVQAGINF